MGWKIKAYIDGRWETNNVVLKTQEEIIAYSDDLRERMEIGRIIIEKRFYWRPTFRFEDGKLIPIKIWKRKGVRK